MNNVNKAEVSCEVTLTNHFSKVHIVCLLKELITELDAPGRAAGALRIGRNGWRGRGAEILRIVVGLSGLLLILKI